MAGDEAVSHVVITCTCGSDRLAGRPVHSACPVPGHGDVPPDPVDPWALVEAGREALGHLDDAVQSILKARAAWVSRGLDSTNSFPVSLDHLAASQSAQWQNLRKWVLAAQTVAERRAPRNGTADQSSESGTNGSGSQR